MGDGGGGYLENRNEPNYCCNSNRVRAVPTIRGTGRGIVRTGRSVRMTIIINNIVMLIIIIIKVICRADFMSRPTAVTRNIILNCNITVENGNDSHDNNYLTVDNNAVQCYGVIFRSRLHFRTRTPRTDECLTVPTTLFTSTYSRSVDRVINRRI